MKEEKTKIPNPKREKYKQYHSKDKEFKFKSPYLSPEQRREVRRDEIKIRKFFSKRRRN